MKKSHVTTEKSFPMLEAFDQAAFEQWADDRDMDMTPATSRMRERSYLSLRTEVAWNAWREVARRAYAEPVMKKDDVDGMRDELFERLKNINRELDQARTSNRALHRRCQKAESAARQTVEQCRCQGVSLGRSLANAQCSNYQDALERIRATVTRGVQDGPFVTLRRIKVICESVLS
jgi:hypothetical protein